MALLVELLTEDELDGRVLPIFNTTDNLAFDVVDSFFCLLQSARAGVHSLLNNYRKSMEREI